MRFFSQILSKHFELEYLFAVVIVALVAVVIVGVAVVVLAAGVFTDAAVDVAFQMAVLLM